VRICAHVSGGPIVQSMKKQGPPPWGMYRVGSLDMAEILRTRRATYK